MVLPIANRNSFVSTPIMLPPFTACSKSLSKKQAKHPLHWSPEQDAAFLDLKRELLKPLAFFLVNPDKPFVIRTDASDYAMGAIFGTN